METTTTVSKKLDALVKLQDIDSQLDEIKKIKGDLPEEVQDLEDEIAGLQTRIQKFKSEIKELEAQIKTQEQAIKEHKKLIAKYKEQQENVRNDREYQAIMRELESQELDIKLAEKTINELNRKMDDKHNEIEKTHSNLIERQKDLEIKQNELQSIIKESEEDEERLYKEREKRRKHVPDNLYLAYQKLRANARNGLAVVSVKRDACGGCFNIVPPQRQVDVKERKKIVVCEHCGRILADVEEVVVVEKKRTVRKARATKAEASEE
jgi:predicted  nucleic acid-binding Zn-ribbon protein